MKNYDKLRQHFYNEIEKNCHGIYKQKAFFHSIQVSTLCQKLALKHHLDIEIAGIMGLFHDYSQFIRHSSFNHAQISSELTLSILQDYGCDQEAIEMIVQAIQCHSHKERIDDLYCEILKDADVLAQYFEEPDRIFNEHYQKRLKEYL